MTQPFLLPRGRKQPLSVEDLFALLSPEKFDAIDERVKRMRESYQCPYSVKNYAGFRLILFEFWLHYLKAIYNWDTRQSADDLDDMTKNQAYQFIEQHLGGYKAILTAERNAVAGRDGGLIAVIDTISEAIGKSLTENYVRSVFFELIEPGDYDTRLRLAKELVTKYGGFLFPGDDLLPYWVLANNIEEFISGFVTQLHTIRRQWRR